MANLFAIFGLTLLFALATSKKAHLVLLEKPGEAVCLDGSPPGYYFRPGEAKQQPNSTELYFFNIYGIL